MQAFIIETANRPGEFARQASAIAQRDTHVAASCLGRCTRASAPPTSSLDLRTSRRSDLPGTASSCAAQSQEALDREVAQRKARHRPEALGALGLADDLGLDSAPFLALPADDA